MITFTLIMNILKSATFFDGIHKHLRFDGVVAQFINTVEFQRLNNIKQLGISYRVYISANHTRFEHSIGVAALCNKFIKCIKTNQPELHISDREVSLVTIAGLLHDIGHACFSHFFDDFFLNNTLKDTENEKWIKHEYRSEMLTRHIISKYRFQFSDDEVDFICEMFNPKIRPKRLGRHRVHRADFMYQFVSNYISGFDCDKIDYLLRDTANIGINHAFEYTGLFESARVIDNIICFPRDQFLNVYELYQLRYKMHKTYYLHKETNLFEFMVLDLLNEVDDEFKISENITDIDTFCSYTDSLIERIKYSTTSSKAKQLIHDIESKNTYKLVRELVHSGRNEDIINKLVTVQTFCRTHKVEHLLIMSNFNINFNMKNKNPVDSISFFDPDEPLEKFHIPKKEISLLLPNVYEETVTRIIIRENPEIKVKGISRTLAQHLEHILTKE
jgi:deoxynucleoside triphosphate triphosphohydrolase SAMHD1